jgi:anti-anti-sigma factor
MNELELDVELHDQDGRSVCVVTASGDVDLATAEGLRSALGSDQVRGGDALVVDLRKVGFIDSSGLAVVLENSQLRGSAFAIVHDEGSAVAKLFEMTGTTAHVRGFSTPEEAVAGIEREDGS